MFPNVFSQTARLMFELNFRGCRPAVGRAAHPKSSAKTPARGERGLYSRLPSRLLANSRKTFPAHSCARMLALLAKTIQLASNALSLCRDPFEVKRKVRIIAAA
jgi:hypothetical protein